MNIYKSIDPSEVLIIAFCAPQHPALQSHFRTFSLVYILSSTYIKASIIPTLTMAPTEMVQTGAPLTQARPSTPPSSPNASSEHVVTLSNAQQFHPILNLDTDGVFDVEMVKAVVAMQTESSPASKCTCSNALPENPTFQASAQPLTLSNLEQLLLKLIEAKSEPPKVSEDAKPDAHPEVTRASKLEYKTVTEVYASTGLAMKHG